MGSRRSRGGGAVLTRPEYRDNQTLAELASLDLEYPIKFRLKWFYRSEGYWISCQEFKPGTGRFSAAISIRPEDIDHFIEGLQMAKQSFIDWMHRAGLDLPDEMEDN